MTDWSAYIWLNSVGLAEFSVSGGDITGCFR